MSGHNKVFINSKNVIMRVKNLTLSILLMFGCIGLSGQSFTHLNYKEDNSNFTNPERGFYHAVSHIDYNELLSYRKQGISLILKTYQLGQFKHGLISTSFLRNMEEDFQVLQNAGMKAVIRFSYTDKSTPPYGDASPKIVLKHVRQLKPVLMANSDVILVLQAGFIGAWGEWYYTDYYSVSPGNISAKNWADRRQLVDSLLVSIPPSRMVQVRTPQYKIKLLNVQDYIAVKPSQAYTDLPIARIAHHNDCFVSSPSDVGTYVDSTVEKPYLAKDSRYTIVGGETCQKCVQSTCSNATKEMSRFHWTFLNQDYNQSIIGEWQNQGCFSEIQKKLGYRFSMLDANLPNQSKPGGDLNIDLSLLNTGWANPTNPRNFEIILKNKENGTEYYLKSQNDIRFWPIHDTIHLHIKAGLPLNMENGDYTLFLNLSDGDAKLNNRPEYSIRMANIGMWDSITGYNSLGHVVNVSNTNQNDTYYGGNYFKRRNQIQSMPDRIIIDGSNDDWSNISILYSATAQKAAGLKITNTSDTLFVMVQGQGLYPHSQFLFDTDNDSTTGAFYGPWQRTGFDYLIENNKLYQYIGTNHEWNWQYVADVRLSQNSQVIELKIPFGQLNAPAILNYFHVGFINNFDGNSDKSYFPLSTENLISVKKNNLSQKPEGLAVRNCGTRNIIYWTRNKQSSNVYTVLQRSENNQQFTDINTLNNNTIAYIDKDLLEDHNYQYRIQYKEGTDLSEFSDTIEQTTSKNSSHFIDIKLNGKADDWNICPPSATGMVHGNIASLSYYNSQDSLFIGMQADMKNTYRLYLNIGDLGGFDYLISNDSLFSNTSGKWIFDKKITSFRSKNFMEAGIKMSEIGLDTANMFSSILFVDGIDVWGGKQTFNFMKYQIIPKPGYFKLQTLSDYTYSRIKISWYPDQSPEGYLIERSIGDSLHFKQLVNLDNTKFQYIDKNLDSTSTYYYRMFAYKDITRSVYTSVQWMKPGITTGINNVIDGSAIVKIIPNPVRQNANIQIFLRNPDNVTISMISITGKRVAELYKGYLKGNEIISFQKGFLKAGYYILQISGTKTHVYKKIIIY
jgi:hypothetical protein